MGLTLPYGQSHYMGEYATEGAALTWIQGNKWDSVGDGSGNPKAGMAFFDTAVAKLKVHDGSAWVALGSASPAGSSTQVQFNDGGAFGADAVFVWDKTNDRLGVGCTDPAFSIEASKDGSQYVCVSSYGTGVVAGLVVRRGRGTRASHTAVQSGDTLGSLYFSGHYDTSASTYSSSSIQSVATENWGASAVGSELRFYTAPNGSAGITQRMVLGQNGYLGLGTTAPLAKFHIHTDGYTGTILSSYDNTGNAYIDFFRARGTLATPSNVQNGDILGYVGFRGYVGGGSNSSQIRAVATENWSASVGSAVAIWTSPNTTGAMREIARFDQSGYLGIGTTSPMWHLTVAGNGDAYTMSVGYGSAARGFLIMAHANGTEASPTALGSYDYIGQINFSGHTGVNWRLGAAIRSMTSQVWTEANRGCGIEFFTTASSTATVRQVASLGQDGVLTMGVNGSVAGKIVLSGATSGTCTLQVAAAAGTTTFQYPATNGSSGQFLQTNGSGVTTWATATATPAGSAYQIQYNAGGSFGATANFYWENSNARIWTLGDQQWSGHIAISYDTGSSNYGGYGCYRYGGTKAAPAVVTNGMTLGVFAIYGAYDASNTTSAWMWIAYASGTWSSGSTPSYMQLMGRSSSSSQYQVMRFSGSNVGIGTHNTMTERLHLKDASNNGALVLGLHEAGTPTAGTVEWNGTNFRGYTGTVWVNLDSSGGTPAGSNTQVQFNDSGSFGADAAFVWDKTNDRLGLGVSSPAAPLDVVPTSDAVLIVTQERQYSATAYPIHLLSRGRGTLASPTAVQSGDYLGGYLIGGQYSTGATDFQRSAGMYAVAAETFATGARGTHLTWWSTPVTTTTITEYMRLTSQGRLGVGCTDPLNTIEAFVDSGAAGIIAGGASNTYNVNPGLSTFRSRGTRASRLALQDGDIIGAFYTLGYYSSTSFQHAASIISYADGAWGAGSQAAHMTFYTTSGTTWAEKMRLTSGGRLYVGLTTAPSVAGSAVTRKLIVAGDTGNTGFAVEAGADASRLDCYRANGTLASKTAVTSGDWLGGLTCYGWDGGATPTYIAAGQVRCEVDAAVSEDNVPGRLAFYTRNSAGTYAERVRITNAGYLGINCTDPTAHFEVSNDAAMYAYISAFGTGIESSLVLRHGRGTRAASSAVQTGDNLGTLWLSGFYGAGTSAGGAYLAGYAAQNWSTGNIGSYLVLATTAVGTSARTERMRITDAGVVQIGLAGGATGRIDLVGTTSGVVSVKVADVAGTWTMTLPTAAPAVTGYVLSATTAGVCSWVAAAAGGGTLDTAYDYGGAGAGRSITADSGAVAITVPNGANNAGLVVTQNNTTHNPICLQVVNNAAYPAIGLTGTNNLIAGSGHLMVGSVTSPTVGASFYFMDTGYSTWLFGNSASANFSATINPALSAYFVAKDIYYTANSLDVATGNKAEVTLIGDEGAGAGNRVNASLIASTGVSATEDTYATVFAQNIGSGDSSIDIVSIISATGTSSALNLHALSNGSGTTAVDIRSQNGSIRFDALGSGYIPFNQTGQLTLTGFTATSIIGALNELRAGVAALVDAGTAAGQVLFWDAGSSKWTYAATSEWVWDDTNKRVGINEASPSSRLDVGGDVEIASDGWHYYGDPTTDGSWRTGRVSADLVVQKRESGTWNTKHTFS